MANEICKEINPECLLISCCSSPCELLYNRITEKLRWVGMKDLYEFFQGHILNKKTCPRCNRKEIQIISFSLIAVRCTFCDKVYEFHLNHNNLWFIDKIYNATYIEKDGEYSTWNDFTLDKGDTLCKSMK